jgi:hypothetical protein
VVPGSVRLLHFCNESNEHPAIGICKTPQVRQNRAMRNPDKWPPMEPEEPDLPKPMHPAAESDAPRTRRGALVGLVLVLLLVAGGLLLTRVLRNMSQLQDCALSGRSNCT